VDYSGIFANAEGTERAEFCFVQRVQSKECKVWSVREILLRLFSLENGIESVASGWKSLTPLEKSPIPIGKMLFASIDIGSNAARLLLANVFDSTQELSTASHVAFVRVPLRLGEDVFHDGMISGQRIANLIKTLTAYKLLIDVYAPVDFDICATAAMREASNREEILERVRRETGLTIRVIDGQEEATIIRESNNLFSRFCDETLMYIDVGGGSTEISILHDNNFVTSRSFNVGTIRMLQENGCRSQCSLIAEDAGRNAPSEHWNEMLRWVEESTKPFKNREQSCCDPQPGIACVGSGGNINKLVKLFGDKTTGRITLKELNEGYNKLNKLSVKERMEKFRMRPDRADVIVPAAKIFSHIMQAAGIDSVLAPKLGLVDGLIYELSQKHLAANPIGTAQMK